MKPYLDDGDVVLHLGDCVEVMAAMDPESVDAIVCDPPYGLEFMGKEWDAFRVDDRSRAGIQRTRNRICWRSLRPRWSDARRTSTGRLQRGGKRAKTSRCEGCGKRDQFRKPHGCPDGTNWRAEIIDPHAAPPSMLAFQEWCETWATEALRVLKPGGHLLAFGGTRTFHRLTCAIEDAGFEVRDCLSWLYGSGFPKSLDVSKAIDKAAGAEREVVGTDAGRAVTRPTTSAPLARTGSDATTRSREPPPPRPRPPRGRAGAPR